VLRRNGPVTKSVGSVLLQRLKESLSWKRFVKELSFEPGVKEREGVMNGESSELTEWEDVVGA